MKPSKPLCRSLAVRGSGERAGTVGLVTPLWALARRMGGMAVSGFFVRRPNGTLGMRITRRRRCFALSVVGMALLMVVGGCNPVGPTGTSGTVTVTWGAPVSWVAVQDRPGAWRRLSGTSFDVSDANGRYGVAWVCPGDNWDTPIPPSVGVVQAIVSEATSVTTFCPASTTLSVPPQYSISGTVSNVPTSGLAMLGVSGPFGSGYWPSVYSPGGQYRIDLQEPGVYDLLAYTKDAYSNPDRMILRRGIAVSGDVTGEDIDFSSGVPFYMVSVTTSSPSGGWPYVSAYLALADGKAFALPEEGIMGASTLFPAMPPSLRQDGDHYELMAEASGSMDFQVVVDAVQDPSSGVTLQLPAPMPSGASFVPSGATAKVTWPQVTLSGTDGTPVFVAWAIGTTSNWAALVSKGWLGASSTYSYPDLSSVSGWRSAWDFPRDQNVPALMGVVRASAGLNPFNQTVDLGQGQPLPNLPVGAKVVGTFGFLGVAY